jgi:hypothetical protein
MTGGLYFGGDDGQFFPKQGIKQGAFACIGFTEYVDESCFHSGCKLQAKGKKK